MEPTEEEKYINHKRESDRMFDLAERCIMEYMCLHLNVDSTLFKTDNVLSNDIKPLIMRPIEPYDKYLSFSLEIVPYDYKLVLPDYLQDHKDINHTLGFIYHSVTTVFNAILNANIADDKNDLVIENSFHLDMDDDSLTFYPVYIYPKRRKRLMFSNLKTEFETILKNAPTGDIIQLSDSVIIELNKVREKLAFISNQLDAIIYDDADADQLEKEKNASFATNQRIGLKFKLVDKDELPANFKLD